MKKIIVFSILLFCVNSLCFSITFDECMARIEGYYKANPGCQNIKKPLYLVVFEFRDMEMLEALLDNGYDINELVLLNSLTIVDVFWNRYWLNEKKLRNKDDPITVLYHFLRSQGAKHRSELFDPANSDSAGAV